MEEMQFFTLHDYEKWKDANKGGKGWAIKYYKGLGTSSAAEAKAYFKDLTKHKLDFSYRGPSCLDAIDLAFAKKRVDDRKAWLRALESGTHIDYGVKAVPFTDFVHKELILFSQADVLRR